jgi:radical SAM protein with 4Fe4S-binding SPASM domain
MEELTTTTFSEFEYSLVQKAIVERLPLFCTFEVTMRCNVKCVHCYVPMNLRTNRDKTFNELGFQDVCSILDEITEMGCLGIKFTGGEIFMRHDFLDIYRYAKSKGLLVNLYTNGTLLNSSIIATLQEWRPMLIEISLYGATKDTYERVTQIGGSYNRCINGINLLHDAGINFMLKTPVFSHNWHEIPKLREFADSLGVDIICSPDIVARLNSDKEPCGLNISVEDAAAIEASGINGDKLLSMNSRIGYASQALFTCSAGKCTFHISADGSLHPCVLYRTTGYKLLEHKLIDGWNGFLKEVTSRQLSPSHRCVKCSLRNICGNCPGKALLDNDSDSSIVDYYCNVTHRVAKAIQLTQ